MTFQKKMPQPMGFQLAPMIDIVFLLLIFFIVTWQFSKDEFDLKVKVPASTQGTQTKRPLGEKIINVREDGALRIDGTVVSQDELFTRLKNVARVHKNQPVRLRGDLGCDWQTMVTVIDVCQRAGIWNISFATQKPESAAPAAEN